MFKELNVMEIFFEAPNREFSVRETAKLLNVAPATASKELAGLATAGLLMSRDDRLAKLYSANTVSDAYKDMSRYSTIRALRNCGIIDKINATFSQPTIILSEAAAEETNLIVISGKKEEFSAKEFENRLKRRLHIIVAGSLSEIDSNLLKNAGGWTVILGAFPLYTIVQDKNAQIPEQPHESMRRRYIQ